MKRFTVHIRRADWWEKRGNTYELLHTVYRNLYQFESHPHTLQAHNNFNVVNEIIMVQMKDSKAYFRCS